MNYCIDSLRDDQTFCTLDTCGVYQQIAVEKQRSEDSLYFAPRTLKIYMHAIRFKERLRHVPVCHRLHTVFSEVTVSDHISRRRLNLLANAAPTSQVHRITSHCKAVQDAGKRARTAECRGTDRTMDVTRWAHHITNTVLEQDGMKQNLYTDKCGRKLGRVLVRKQIENVDRRIGYRSNLLNDFELNLDDTHPEYLAVVWTILLLRPNVKGTEFTVQTDH